MPLGSTSVPAVDESPPPADIEIPYGNNSEAGRYVEVNGIRLYVETYGEGPPLLVIHGLGASIKYMHNFIPHFSRTYKVIVADSRGHGKSEMGTGPLTYDQMTED